MTSEIAIMNKHAVALAADSAVTMGSGEKVFQTVNKLFMLSKFHPVGIMIYGNGEFCGIPWETIIKEYRKNLGKTKQKSIPNYVDDFKKYLDSLDSKIPQNDQVRNFTNYLSCFFQDNIIAFIDYEIKAFIQKNDVMPPETEIQKIANGVIKENHEIAQKIPFIDGFDAIFETELRSTYSKDIKKIIQSTFKDYKISPDSEVLLEQLSIYQLCRDCAWKISNVSGIVIAGFGDEDIFPIISSFQIKLIINHKIIWGKSDQAIITAEKPASIRAYAQDEMVRSFIEGVMPNYRNFIKTVIEKLYQNFPKTILAEIPNLDPKQNTQLLQKFENTGKKAFDDFMSAEANVIGKNWIPILNTVIMLPKDELAVMAETLINLTSFKRRMSIEQIETVGGPIDVAVISKGDGFIWIKRKHYFKPELNPYYFSKYYKKI